MRTRFRNHFIPHEGNDFKPHFVRERNVIGVALLVIAIFGLALSLKNTVTRNPDLLSAVITGVLVDLTNVNRLSEHLTPLELNPILASAAQLKADDMAAKSYFAHTSPEGKTPWYWFKEKGYEFVYAGENLAVNFVDSEDVVRAWMNSPGHKANILNDHFTEIGIALASGTYQGQPTIFVVQLFGQPVASGQLARSVPVVDETVESLPEPESTTVLAETTEVPITEEVSTTSDNVLVLAESEMFVAVQNNDYLPADDTASPVYNSIPDPSLVDKTLASPKLILETIYLVLGALVLFALAVFITMKRRREHRKNVIYVILLLILIVILLYLSSATLFPQILVE